MAAASPSNDNELLAYFKHIERGEKERKYDLLGHESQGYICADTYQGTYKLCHYEESKGKGSHI